VVGKGGQDTVLLHRHGRYYLNSSIATNEAMGQQAANRGRVG
jgi:hypothetical protein